ncbi:family 20 glycosylhydrolase [Rhodopirellula sp. JC740]|uniref:beta-N-acetylhexosaminidase n=1 Tax=Rhodopirellula halodulae TaxID=2894198 RepID=A0ABS8NMG2_9BACT|nr:family 20 glycosylhydrolase [Rhodopirellula sp. JC740]MCC9644772.1 family 20 glycosylhydrolase [Rhodopirellula sp. JC740]
MHTKFLHLALTVVLPVVGLVLTETKLIGGDATSAMVPLPVKAEFGNGETYSLPPTITYSSPSSGDWDNHLTAFAKTIQRLTGENCTLVKAIDDKAGWTFSLDESLSASAYSIDITTEGIGVKAGGIKGLSYATATLLQLVGGANEGELLVGTIRDEPKLSYRNLMIDMGRNPHSVELLKQTIDFCWFYKIDSVQLHLTDDQRIAFPFESFPKLSDGLITLDEFHELEAYAVVRGVTLIPELEVPGHSGLIRRVYPEVFGETGTELASTPKALEGIQTMLDDLMSVFQSTPYIHIGGDEAFGVPEELQRELINKLHQFLKSKGKQTLVWEGPAPGKGDNRVNAEVIHINWRTINYPADQMLKDGYRVVNAAWDPLYLVDHYPRTNFTMTSPQRIYEKTSLTTFKHVNPGIHTYANPIEVEPSDQLIGFCMPWWEGREENYYDQVFPRAIPFAEVAWNPEIERDFASFEARSQKAEAIRLRSFYPVKIEADALAVPADGVFHNQTTVSIVGRTNLPADNDDSLIRFTTDGSAVNADSQRYEQPFEVDETVDIRARLFVKGSPMGAESQLKLIRVQPKENLALGKPVTSSVSSAAPFSVERVTDGGTGPLDFYLGYPAVPEPIAITIDLETPQTVQRVLVHAFTVQGSFEKYSVEVSLDGEHFTEVGSRKEKPETETSVVEHAFEPQQVRYVRILSEGNRGYVFDSFSKILEVEVH